jgi:hypothetical protein
MKCSKCGFTSFDYLAECKKCGEDIAEIRDSFGFHGVKPAVPFFLGSLLKGYVQPPPIMADDVAENRFCLETEENDNVAASAVGEFDDFHDAAVSETASAKAASETGTELDDFSILDISDEELDMLLDSTGSGVGPQSDSIPAIPSPRVKTGTSGPAKNAAAATTDDVSQASGPQPDESEDSLVIDLSEHDLEGLLTELENAPAKGESEITAQGS